MNKHSHHVLSRRGFCLCCLASSTFAATGGWLTPSQVFAQARNVVDAMRASAADAPITIHMLRGNVSALVGSGGNIAVLTGSDGKLLVDSGLTASRPRILAALDTLGREPIAGLINTHWHFDHADGNEWMDSKGAAILAHENTRKHLAEATRVDDWDYDFPASPTAAVPTEVFSEHFTLNLNKSGIQLKHYGPAHTDGDAVVLFTETDILHAGDIYWNGFYPFIDYSTGGSIDGTIQAVEAILATVSDGTIIIPGHGEPASNRAELRSYRDMLATVREKVSALKVEGRTLEETVAARPTERFDAKWGQFIIAGPVFTKLVYAGV